MMTVRFNNLKKKERRESWIDFRSKNFTKGWNHLKRQFKNFMIRERKVKRFLRCSLEISKN